MKVALILSLVLLTSFTGAESQDGTFILRIEGLRNSKGTVRVGVYNAPEKFPEEGGTVKNLAGKIENGTCTIRTELSYGSYAFALLHDENNNTEMDYSWLGIPQEGFGFSRNPKVGLSAPSFEETKVILNSAEKTVVIKVKYM